MTGKDPGVTGAPQVTVACAFPALAVTLVGALGGIPWLGVGFGAAKTAMVKLGESDVPALFDALTVNDEVPAVVGVPLSIPVFGSRVSPAGKLPADTEKVGASTPLAVNVYGAYAMPTVAEEGGVSSRMTGGIPATKITQVSSAAPKELLTRITKVYVPRLVGVPANTPVPGVKLRPGGSVPEWTDMVRGVFPVAVKV